MNNLNQYNNKRNFNKTKEPIGRVNKKSNKKLKFVIQHHIARKDHYDFRLEFDGVLKSWAVPKGPSFNTSDKRLAVKVEDHPFNYKDFEGIIPEGEYGAGTVMIFDCGYYELNSMYKDFKNGPLKFTLYGQRFKGKYTLIKYKENNWLLIKEKDKFVSNKKITSYKTSIKTKRTMSQIKKDNLTKVNITSPDKIIKGKITKQDIASYYLKVFDRMFPYLDNRLISTKMCPNNKECFFKKHFSFSKFLKKTKLKTTNDKNDYYYVNDLNGLMELVQNNNYEIHIWGSKVNKINTPDIMVFDLDPDEKLSLDKLRIGVRDLKKILDKLGLKSYLKTSGGKGYHILIPFKEKISWKKFTMIAKNIASLMENKYPEKYTSNMRKSERTNKIYIDWVRNTKGATFVAPYSLKIKNKITVSLPIKWSELDKIKPDEITIEKCLKKIKNKNPWEDFFD